MTFRLSRAFLWIVSAALVAAYVWSSFGAVAATQTTVGEVNEAKGRTWGVTQWGEQYDKLGGDLVAMDEVVATGVNSAMTMSFIDKTTLTLGENAEMTIDEMVYNPEDGTDDTVVINLGKGSFYFVSGLVAKEKVTLVTPTATIGIRGTELVIDVGEDGSTSVGVAKGRAFMISKRGGREVDVKVGTTAKTSAQGEVSDPFPGLDLTGEKDVDKHIPGASEWLDSEENDDNETVTEFSYYADDAKENGDGRDGGDGQDDGEGDGRDFTWDDGEPNDDVGHGRLENDSDEVARGEHEGDGGDGGDGGDSDGGDSDGGDSDGGDSDGGDSDGGDSDGGDSDGGDSDGGDSDGGDSDGGDSDGGDSSHD